MSKGTRRPPVRPVSRTTKKAAALKDCRCFDEVERRLRLGWSSKDLAVFIREESEELTDLSERYVRKMIDEHRKSIPPAELALTTQNTHAAMHANRRLANGLNELEELEDLYQKQKSRIEIEMKNEKGINKLLPQTGREIFYAMKILKQSADLKMDLGIAKRQLGEVSVTGAAAVQISDRYHDGVGRVMSDPDSRRKVLGMVHLLSELSDKGAMDPNAFAQDASEIIDVDVGDEDAEDLGDEQE